MQVKISGQHLEVTEAMRSYMNEKLERLERHFDKITSVQIIMSVDKLLHKAEGTLYLAQDMYAAIDALTDKLDRQLIKHKEKTQNKH